MELIKIPLYYTLKKSKKSRYNSWTYIEHIIKVHNHLPLSDKSNFCKFCGCIYKQNKDSELFSIRPNSYSYIPEIEPGDIIKILKHKNNQMKITQCPSKDKFFSSVREKIIKKIRLYLFNNGIQLNLIYPIIYYFDYIRLKCNFTSEIKLEKVAIVAIMYALKFHANAHIFTDIKDLMKNFKANNFYSLPKIQSFEIYCIKNIFHYDMDQPHLFEIISIFLTNGTMFCFDKNRDNKINLKLYDKMLSTAKQIMEDCVDYLSYDQFKLSCAIIGCIRKEYDLEEWPKILEEIYQIKKTDFISEISYVKSFLKRQQINLNIHLNKNKNLLRVSVGTRAVKSSTGLNVKGKKNLSMSVEATRDNTASKKKKNNITNYFSKSKKSNSTEKKRYDERLFEYTRNLTCRKKKNSALGSLLNYSLEQQAKEFEDFKKKILQKNFMSTVNKNRKHFFKEKEISLYKSNGFFKTTNIKTISKIAKKGKAQKC